MMYRINKILQKYIGLKIIKSGEGILRNIRKRKSKPIHIEFVGVAGVGKTTLFKKVSETSKNKWLSMQGFRNLFLYRFNAGTLDPLPFYQDLASHKIKSVVESKYCATDKMEILRYFYSVLTDDILLYLFNKDYTIVHDGGLIHNYGDDILGIFKRDKNKLIALIQGRAVVYCYAPAENIARQIVERVNQGGHLAPQHKVDSFENLVKKQKEALKRKYAFINILQEFGLPVLLINTSDKITYNAEKINGFIVDLQRET